MGPLVTDKSKSALIWLADDLFRVATYLTLWITLGDNFWLPLVLIHIFDPISKILQIETLFSIEAVDDE